MLRKLTAALVLIVLPCLTSQVLSAQTTATISGSVKDGTGGMLPGATVSVTNTDTGISRTAVADTDGRYRITNLNIGQYEMSAGLAGFQTAVRRGIALTIGREAIIDMTLTLGDITEDVTVTADARLVDTRSGSIGTIVDRETILEIPLRGRDLTGLITMQAGVTVASKAAIGASNGYSTKFSIGGARPEDNAVLLDGTDVRSFDQGVPAGVSGNFLGGEAIQEFKVERNAYSAEYGGSAGGVINVVSKSGGNDFHGSVYGFSRNAAWDATNFRAPSVTDEAGNFSGKVKPDFWRAQYGASVGGRIVRNRTFYFANFEGLRERLGFTTFVTTLSAAGRQGRLGSRTVEVKPSVVPYFDLWPLPADAQDLGDGTAHYSVIESQPTDEDFYQLRVDHNFGASDSLFGRVTRQVSNRTTPQEISRWSANSKVYNTFTTMEHKKILTSQLLNTFRFGFNRRGIADFSTESPGVDPALFMVPVDKWLYPMGAEPIMGTINVTGLTTVGLGRGWVDRDTNRFQFVNGTVYSRGAHTLRFGVDVTHMRMGGDNPSRPGGDLSFASVETFLRGQPRQFRGDVLPETDFNRNVRWNTVGSYVQDDWQIHPRATINLGFRHDFYTVPYELDGKIANLKDPLTDKEITVLGTRGDAWWENPSLMNFSPRVGIAWDPTGSGLTAIRAGAGVFHNLISAELFRQPQYRTAPFGLETNFQAAEGVMPFPAGLYDFIVGLGPGQADIFVFPYYKDDVGNARMAQWNANIQRELGKDTAVTLSYLGSRGLQLNSRWARNTAVAALIDGRYVFPAGAARPNSTFNIEMLSQMNVADSWYKSLQLEVRRRFSAGFQAHVAYSWADTVDIVSLASPTTGRYIHAMDLDRGPSDFHVGQRLTGSVVWQLPGGNAGGLLGNVFGGWQLSGILNVSEGNPYTLLIGSQSALAALGLGRFQPDLISGGDDNPVTGDPDRYFDPTQFKLPPARTIGNVGRNSLDGPGMVNVDLGLTRNVQFGGKRLQFRVEVFNLLNRVNLGAPNTTVMNGTGVPNPLAGFIGSTSTTARQTQLGMRIDW